MKEHISTPFLRESLEFTIGVIDFSDNLIRMKKESIATKILDSAVGISSNLQLCKTAAKPSESNEFLRRHLHSSTQPCTGSTNAVNRKAFRATMN